MSTLSFAQRVEEAPKSAPKAAPKQRPQSAKPAAAKPQADSAQKAQPAAAGSAVAAPRKTEAPKGAAPKGNAAPKPAQESKSADAVSPAAPAARSKSDGADDSVIKIDAPQKKVAGFATVKAVTSGDSVIVVGNSAASEKRISISGISAPKFGTRDHADEPFAWQAREFLRKKLLGEKIHFCINAGNSGRDYADVHLKDENIARVVVSHGWAKVKPPKEGRQLSGSDSALFEEQQKAEASQIGMFKKVDQKLTIREVDYQVDANALYQKCKNFLIPAVVDKVIDGSTIRVELLDPAGSLKHKVINLCLAGVSCPRTPMPYSVRLANYTKKMKENPGSKEQPPKQDLGKAPFGAMEATQFVDQRLLNQDVKVLLQGCDKMNNLFGTIVFPKGNISVKLLEKGFGTVVEWSLALCHPNEQKAMREANARAKAGKQGLFHNYDASKEVEHKSAYEKEFEAKIVQVNSGDAIAIHYNGTDHKLYLASVRAPRIMRGRMTEPYSFEAREYLRKKVIGKKVKIVSSYVHEQEGVVKQYVDVYVGAQNVAVEMLEKGLLTVSRHTKDEDRSRHYDALILAESKAVAASQGQHSKKPVPPPQIADLTALPSTRPRKGEEGAAEEKGKESAAANASRAKIALNALRGSQVQAVVEHVFTGARFKLYVPQISSYIAFALADIRVPSFPKGEERSAIADEALAYTRSKTLHHDVLIDVVSLGKGDVFTGNLFVSGKQNFATSLLRLGVASIFGYSADRSPYKKELQEAEKQAKAAKLKLWVDYDEAKEAELAAKANAEKAQTEKVFKDGEQFLNVTVTDIVSPVNFYVNVVGDKRIEEVAKRMKAFVPAETAEPFKPSRNTVCAGLFPEDKSWYRVRVDNISKGAEGKADFSVQFIDFGNCTVLSEGSLFALPEDLAKIPQVARPCTFAALKAPLATSEYTEPACTYLHELTYDQPLIAKVELADNNNLLHVTLTTKDADGATVSINNEMLSRGWVRINQRPHRRLTHLTEDLEKHEEAARLDHRNIWEYGDVSDGEGDREL